MKEFFKVSNLADIHGLTSVFNCVGIEMVDLQEAFGRISAETIFTDIDLPGFSRSTMDGYAVCAASTFGASEGNPAYLNIKGAIHMGTSPDFSISPGEAAKISTGGMLPHGADSVVMIEFAEAIDDITIEVYRSVAPGQHVVEKGEDFKKHEIVIPEGTLIRPQETGLLAALGKTGITVYKKPVVGIISTGNEIVPVDTEPAPGQIRDVNSYTLAGFVRKTGGIPKLFGIVRDDYDDLFKQVSIALDQSDMLLLSGGSSVGTRDFTIEVLSSLPDSKILAHGITISPGKPTILAKAGGKAVWGLPGHVTSAMVVFEIVVKPFIDYIAGLKNKHTDNFKLTALLSRNISSAPGRIDFVRVRLIKKDGVLWAEPVLGKSGLINTMVKADGLIEIDMNTEGLDKGTEVAIIPI